MKVASNPLAPLARFGKRFRLARRGAAAVEFAMLAMPFFGLICGIIEIGMIYVVATTLEDATNSAARQIRTGQTQTATTPATPTSFAGAICSQLAWLGSACASNLNVDVRTYNNFTAVTPPNPISNGQFQTTGLQFNTGGPCDIVVVRSYYQWALFTPMMNQALQNLSGGKMLISSAAAFRNEPYQTASPSCSAPL